MWVRAVATREGYLATEVLGNLAVGSNPVQGERWLVATEFPEAWECYLAVVPMALFC